MVFGPGGLSMKKITKIWLLALMSTSLCSCTFHLWGWYPFGGAPLPISCDIKFAKDVDSKGTASDYYEKSQKTTVDSNSKEQTTETYFLPVKTDVYVMVDFSITNNSDDASTIAYKVTIPFADYFSAIYYVKGEIKPTQITEPSYLDSEHNLKIISGMAIPLKGKQTVSLQYIFGIQGDSVEENLKFNCYFENADGAHIDLPSDPYYETFDFVGAQA
jgi:hypothetical protein